MQLLVKKKKIKTRLNIDLLIKTYIFGHEIVFDKEKTIQHRNQ